MHFFNFYWLLNQIFVEIIAEGKLVEEDRNVPHLSTFLDNI